MDTPYLELRETDASVYELYKDELPTGRVYNFNDDDSLDLTDEFFELTAAGLPAKELTLSPLIDGKETWLIYLEIARDEKYITLDFHCHFDYCNKDDKAYLLNGYALSSKIMEQALNHGFIKGYLGSEGSCVDFKKKFSLNGILRNKVKTAIDILERLRVNAEREMVETISKGMLFINVPDVNEKKSTEKE